MNFAKTIGIGVIAGLLSGCGGKISEVQDKALGGFVARSGLQGACNMPLEDLKFFETKQYTAGQLKESAWIVGISFTCANAITGRRPWTVYVGFVDLKPKTANDATMKCLAWNSDKEKLKSGMNWLSCGGLNV